MKNQGQRGSRLALSITGALEESLAVDNGWTQTVSQQQLVDCDTVNYACDSGLMSNGFDFAEKKALCTEISVTTPRRALASSSVTWRSHRKCHGKQGHVHQQREGFEVSSSTATRVHHQSGDKIANRKGSCSLKTLVERHGAQTKASDGESIFRKPTRA